MTELASHVYRSVLAEYHGDPRRALAALAERYVDALSGASRGFLRIPPSPLAHAPARLRAAPDLPRAIGTGSGPAPAILPRRFPAKDS